jgi:hypothetical protein
VFFEERKRLGTLLGWVDVRGCRERPTAKGLMGEKGGEFGAKSLGRRVWGEEFRAKSLGRRVWGEEFGAKSLGRRVLGEEFGAKSLGRRVWGEECGAKSLGRRAEESFRRKTRFGSSSDNR